MFCMKISETGKIFYANRLECYQPALDVQADWSLHCLLMGYGTFSRALLLPCLVREVSY